MEKEIKIIINVPCKCTDEQLLEWVKFELNYCGSIQLENPLSDYELEATNIDIQ